MQVKPRFRKWIDYIKTCIPTSVFGCFDDIIHTANKLSKHTECGWNGGCGKLTYYQGMQLWFNLSTCCQTLATLQ